MNREIKFRCWGKNSKEYLGSSSDGFNMEELSILAGQFKNWEIEQHTGLKDNNGKEIYEGDIVKTNSPDQPNFKVGVIEFVQQAFWISNVPSNRPDHTHSELLLQYWETEIEVIGNINETPELLDNPLETFNKKRN